MAALIRRKKLQGILQQSRRWNTSKAIMHFRFSTAWVDHGRIMIVNDRNEQFWSVDWETWARRAMNLVDNIEQIRIEYPNEAAQLESTCESMLRLARIARDQPQPPVMTAADAGRYQQSRKLYVPGADIGPAKKLILPENKNAYPT